MVPSNEVHGQSLLLVFQPQRAGKILEMLV